MIPRQKWTICVRFMKYDKDARVSNGAAEIVVNTITTPLCFDFFSKNQTPHHYLFYLIFENTTPLYSGSGVFHHYHCQHSGVLHHYHYYFLTKKSKNTTPLCLGQWCGAAPLCSKKIVVWWWCGTIGHSGADRGEIG